MRQRLRNIALVALLGAVALVAPRSASAQLVVTPNGIGDLLVYGYWTAYERDTLIALTHPFGGQNRYVHIRIREGRNSAEVANFTVCLSPGDVWTAAITSGGRDSSSSFLLVGNPGSCDASVTPPLTAPPAPGDPALGLAADFGYIEAYTMECNSLRLPNALCTGPQAVANAATPTNQYDGGDDAIMGTATLVSAEAGFASSYNATSWVHFDAYNESAAVSNATGIGTVLGRGNTTNVNRALAREGGVDKEVLVGRWTASTLLNSTTQLVLTFPGDSQPENDPVSIWVFDEDENFNFSPREIILDWEVNICTFQNSNETDTGNTQLSCNSGGAGGLGGAGGDDIVGPGGTFSGGWFRVINNNDFLAGDLIGDGSGAEFNDINSPPDSRFAVIGLLFSFFEGVNGIFDQHYPIQWYAVLGIGGLGGSGCIVSNPGFPNTCTSYDLQPEYTPYVAPFGVLVPPTDNFFGGLSLAGSNDTGDALTP